MDPAALSWISSISIIFRQHFGTMGLKKSHNLVYNATLPDGLLVFLLTWGQVPFAISLRSYKL